MLVYYTPGSGAITCTVLLAPGAAPPPGDCIEVAADVAAIALDPARWLVQDGQLVPRPDLADLLREEARSARAAAFAAEADPMAFKLLRGEASPEAYAALVAEIRARHPYPEETEQAHG